MRSNASVSRTGRSSVLEMGLIQGRGGVFQKGLQAGQGGVLECI